MKLFSLLSLVLITAVLGAQTPGMGSPLPATEMAYSSALPLPTASSTTDAAATRDRYRLRRERTLFGDLDLSGIWGGPTYNYTSTGDDWALVRGGFGGLELNDDVFIGYGGWASREDFTTDAAGDGALDEPEYSFRHGGFILGYSPGADNVIHPRFTAIVGPGRIEIPDTERERFLVGQMMAGAELNLFQWFRLGIEGGYRFASGIDSDQVSSSDVSGAVVQVEARFGFSW